MLRGFSGITGQSNTLLSNWCTQH